jgi:hypothetical protein
MTDNNGMTEGTNILVDYLAYTPKLIDEDERWHYTKNNDEVDENFDTYVSHHDNMSEKKPQNEYDNNQDNFQSKTNYNTYSDNNNQNNQPTSDKPKINTNKFIDEEYENLSPLEKRLRRLDIMRSLGELRDLGCKVTNYNIDDDYYMMKYELDLHRSIRSKRNWLGLYSHMLIGAVKGVELLNNNYNPFDFSLKGLSDEVKADKNTYYEILGEIYEHHNVPGKKMNPWFRLFVTLIGVVVVVGGKNNAHKFIPNRAQSVENDEEYIEKLRAKAAKDSQSQVSKSKQNGNNGNGNNDNNNQNIQNNNLDDYMNRHHEQAAQRARDIEELKKQELEYQRYQQMMAQEKNNFNNIKKGLEMTASPRSMASSKTNSVSQKQMQMQMQTQTQHIRNSPRQSPRQSPKLNRNSVISNDKDTMSNMSTTTSNTIKTSQTSKSSVSQISINNNLVKKLNKMNNKKNNKKNTDDITIEQISFGSNKKK